MARRRVVQRPLAREHLNAKLETQRVEELRTRKLLGLGANFFVNERRGRDSNPRSAGCSYALHGYQPGTLNHSDTPP